MPLEAAQLFATGCFPQPRSVLSPLPFVEPLPVSTERPFGEKATEFTGAVWPVKRRSSLPLAVSQSRAVLSQLPVNTAWPCGEKDTEDTRAVWPVKRHSSSPLAAS